MTPTFLSLDRVSAPLIWEHLLQACDATSPRVGRLIEATSPRAGRPAGRDPHGTHDQGGGAICDGDPGPVAVPLTVSEVPKNPLGKIEKFLSAWHGVGGARRG